MRPRRVRQDRPLRRAVGRIVELLRAGAVAAGGQVTDIVIAGLGLEIDVVGQERLGNGGLDYHAVQGGRNSVTVTDFDFSSRGVEIRLLSPIFIQS